MSYNNGEIDIKLVRGDIKRAFEILRTGIKTKDADQTAKLLLHESRCVKVIDDFEKIKEAYDEFKRSERYTTEVVNILSDIFDE